MTAEDREELSRLLAGGVPTGADDLTRIQAFAAVHADPFDRRLLPGHLTASAFVLDGAGRLLLTHHRRLDRWLQLGGHAEAERRAERVALREAREESGLPDLRLHPACVDPSGRARLFDVDVHAIPAGGDEPAHEHLDLRFVLVTGRPDEVEVATGESRGLAWLPIDEARRRAAPDLDRPLRHLVELVESGW